MNDLKNKQRAYHNRIILRLMSEIEDEYNLMFHEIEGLKELHDSIPSIMDNKDKAFKRMNLITELENILQDKINS